MLGTIVSRPRPTAVSPTAAISRRPRITAYPAVKGIDGATVTALNDEHAIIAVPPRARCRIGDRVQLLPSHTDPTVNLHDVFYVIEGDRVVDVWPISARGYHEHRITPSS